MAINATIPIASNRTARNGEANHMQPQLKQGKIEGNSDAMAKHMAQLLKMTMMMSSWTRKAPFGGKSNW